MKKLNCQKRKLGFILKNKFYFLFLLSSIFLLPKGIFAQTATAPSVGDGSSGNPYQIATLNNLYWITQNTSSWDKYFLQTADIDASSSSTWDAGAGFSPIGNSSTNFTGFYNGGNFTIDGLYIDRSTNYIGLFGFSNNSTISNLKLTNADISGGDFVGVISSVLNNSTATNCTCAGSVNGGEYTGGFIGLIYNSSITNCGSDVIVSALDRYAGGFVGHTQNSTISTSYSIGNVSNTSTHSGGFVGSNYNDCAIDNCYSTGNVSGATTYTGGFVGVNAASSTISNSYSTGTSTSSFTGGFIDVNYNLSNTPVNCFWDTETSLQGGSHGGTGKTTAEMQNGCTFLSANWDFADETVNGSDDYWTINTAEYPSLTWEGNTNYLAPCEGAGTEGDPYQIESLGNLFWLSQNSSDWDKYFIQTADIDASETSTWDGGAGFTPIGNNTTKFTGEYNGAGFVIEGLTINRATGSLAMFGETSFATIKNLGITLVSITGTGGGLYNGSLVAWSFSSTIQNCFSTGSISAAGRTGGLVGQISGTSSIVSNCYSHCTVVGTSYVGGLVGLNYETVDNCYSTGSVSGTSSFGGLIGSEVTSITLDSFWDTQTSGQATSASGTGKTTAEMQDIATYTSTATTGLTTAWDFTGIQNDDSGTDDTWNIVTGINNGYPYIQIMPDGLGAESDPYQIANLNNLLWFSQNSGHWDKYFIQTADIDASATSTWDAGAGFSPIGNSTTNFTGEYNGADYTIDGLFINRSGTDHIGLFGYTFGAVIDNLGLTNIDITGKTFVGGLIGYNLFSSINNAYTTGSVTALSYDAGGLISYSKTSTVSNCYSEASVNGSNNIVGGLIGNNLTSSTINNCYSTGSVNATGKDVGGLVGYNQSSSTINNCYSTGNVTNEINTSYDYTGGLVGQNNNSEIHNSYSTGNVTGDRYVGGLIGYNYSSSIVTNAYSTGIVTGGIASGGLVGANGFSTVNNSFWDTETSGKATSAGGIGKTTAQMKNLCTYIDGNEASWDFMNETTNGTDNYWGLNSSENNGYPFLAWQGYSDTETCCPAPTEAATSIVMGSVTTSSINFTSYTAPANGAYAYAVYVNSSDSWSAPNDGDEPSADISWNDAGQQCIYFGTSVSPNITVTGLPAGATSYFKVYAYNDCGGTETYETTGVGANATTDKLDQTITFGSLASKTYGDADFVTGATVSSGLSIAYSSSNTDVATIVSGKIHIVAAGTCTIYADQAGNSEYNAAPQKESSLIINKASLTVTADDDNKTYGDANPTFTVSYSGFVNSETSSVLGTKPTASCSATATSSANDYDIIVSGGVDGNYSFSYVTGTLTIEKASLTATADDKSKIYGNINPVFTITYSGFVNSDDADDIDTEPTISTIADETSNVNTYAITITGGSDINYTFGTLNNGTLTVNKATLTATADNKSKIYAAANPALTISYSGFVNSDDAADIGTEPSITTLATTVSNAGTYDITLSGGSDNNYTFGTLNNGTLTINKATLTATADNKSKTYGAANPALTISYSGFVNSDDADDINTKPTVSTTATVSSNAGAYTITLTGGSDNNYTFGTLNNGTLTVNKVSLTATADDKSKIYGNINPVFTITYSGFVNSDDADDIDTEPTISTIADETSSVGDYTITITGGSDINYTFGTLNNGTLTVNKAELTVTAHNKSKTYGEANPTLTFIYSGFVNSESETDLTTAPTASTLADAASNAGEYDITISGGVDGNYSFTYQTGTLTITKANQTITITEIPQKDIAVDPLTFDVSASTTSGLALAYAIQSGPATISGTTITLNGNTGTVTVEVGQVGNINYNSASLTESFIVIDNTKSDQTITFEAIADKSYGEEFTLGATASSGLDVNYVVKSGSATIDGLTVSITGVGDVIITATQDGDATYNPASTVDQTFTAQKAELTITADSKTKTYGDANPVFTISYEGFVNNEDETVLTTEPTTSTLASATSGVGNYDITVSGGEAENYSFTYVSNSLIVNKAALTVTANSTSKIYGDANPTFSFTYSGFVNGENQSVLTTEPTVSTIADAASNSGDYDISVSGGADDNYSFTYVDATLSINKATLIATADDKTRTYGGADPEFTISYAGFVNGDNASNIDTEPTTSTTANTISNVGDYAITLSGGSDNNYTFESLNSGTLTVNQVELTVTARDTSRNVGELNPVFVIDYEGFVNSEDESVFNTLPTANTTADETSGVGTYGITVSGGDALNYTFAYVSGILTVTTQTAIDNVVYESISIYPNPVQDILVINNIRAENTEIRIYNLIGNLVEIHKATESIEIDLSRYSQGVYLIQIGSSIHRIIKN